ncbi:MAG: SRPBCC domain-containing protein [Chloroflexota bacterium]|nr:SRPBCC domain-containing protein [Chloroflexota bacterium]
MRIRSRHKIKCDRESVWDRLIDFKYLSRVIPGGRRFSQSGRNKFKGTLSVPILGKIKVTLTRKNITEPKSFRLNVYSKGIVNGNVNFTLFQKGDCQTELNIEGTLNLKGVLKAGEGAVQKKLKKAIKDLCNKIEKDCKCDEKRLRSEDTKESARKVSKVESQFEQEVAEIISKAQNQFEVELAELITKAGSQLQVDLTELISRIENQQQEEQNAH